MLGPVKPDDVCPTATLLTTLEAGTEEAGRAEEIGREKADERTEDAGMEEAPREDARKETGTEDDAPLHDVDRGVPHVSFGQAMKKLGSLIRHWSPAAQKRPSEYTVSVKRPAETWVTEGQEHCTSLQSTK